jgi:hypothetical protein
MQRRDFLTAGSAGLAVTTLGAALGTTLTATTALAQGTAKQEFLEVRKYTVKDADKRTQLVDILDKALVPALNRQGLKPVGVLIPKAEAQNETKYALNVFAVIPHKTMESFVSVNTKLVADAEYRKAAAPIFETTSRNPVYTDCETFMLECFATMPTLETPELGPNRVYQMRLYRSFNIERNAAKINMFESGGELALFRELGLNPIFFGNIVAGTRLPAFIYMVGFASPEKQNEAWQTFGRHPKWIAMRDLPEYRDTATEIDNIVLAPSPGSQF